MMPPRMPSRQLAAPFDRLTQLLSPHHPGLNPAQQDSARQLSIISIVLIVFTLVGIGVQVIVFGRVILPRELVWIGIVGLFMIYALSRSRYYMVGLYLAVGAPWVLGLLTMLVERSSANSLLLIPSILLAGLFFRARVTLLMTILSAGVVALMSKMFTDSSSEHMGIIICVMLLTGTVLALNMLLKHSAEKARYDSDTRYRALFQDSLNIVYLHDFEGNIVDANDAALSLMGYTRADIPNLNFAHLIDPDDLPNAQSTLKEIIETGVQKVPTIFSLRTRSGEIVHVETMSSIIRQDDGNAIVQGIARDITDYIHTMKSLWETELSYRSLFEQSNDAVFIFDMNQNYKHVNQRAADMLGYEVAELLAMPARQITAPSDVEHSQQIIERILAGEKLAPYERRFIRRDGTIIIVEVNSEVVLDTDGKPFHIQSIARDITARKQMEHELREAEMRYRSLFEQSNDAVFILDLDGSYLRCNQRAADMLGYTIEETNLLSVFDIIDPSEHEHSKAVLKRLLGGEKLPIYERHMRHKDGSTFPVEINIEIVRDDRGQPHHLQSIVRDITERKRLEAELLDREAYYRQVVEEAPIAILEQDLSHTRQYLQQLISSGITDLRSYLEANPEEITASLRRIRVVDINNEGLRLYSVQSKQTLIDRFGELVGTNESQINSLIAIATGQRVFTGEFVDYGITGDPVALFVKWSVLPGYEESFEKVLVSSIDITERRKLESKLRSSEAHYRQLFEEAPISIWEQDFSQAKQYLDELKVSGITDIREHLTNHPETIKTCLGKIRVTDVNKTGVKIHHAKHKSDLIDGLMGIVEIDASQVDSLTAVANGETTFVGESLNRSIHGDPITVLLKWVVMPGYEQTYEKVMISVLDITERKRMEDALRRNEELLNETGDIARIGGWEIDLESDHIVWTRMLRRIREVPDDFQPTLADAISFYHPEDQPIISQAIKRIRKDGTPFDLELRLITTTGKQIWVQVIGRSEWKDNRCIRVHGVMQDITRRREIEAALREREHQLQTILETQSELIARYTKDTTLTYVNEAYCRTFGLSREELIGGSFLSRTNEQEHEYIQDYVNWLFNSGRNFVETEQQVTLPDGSMRWYLWMDQVIRDEAGNPIEVQAAGRDITERKLAGLALQESERRYRIVADLNTNWTYWQKADNSLEYVSPACETITGYSTEDLQQNPSIIDNIIYEDDRELWLAHRHENPANDAPRSIQLRIHHREGMTRWIEHTSRPIYDDTGRFDGYHVSNQDITDRKQAEEALRQSEESYRVVLQGSPIIVAHCDMEARYIWIHNPHPDFSASDIMGKRDDEVAQNDGTRRLRELKERVIRTGKGERMEITFPVSSGDHIYTTSAEPLRDQDGNIIGVTTVAFDITESRQAQKREFEIYLEKERMQILTSFIQNAAHSFRTPLAVINSSAFLMARSDDPKQRQQKADKIEEQVLQTTDMIDMLLKMTKLESYDTLMHAPVNIDEIIKSLCDEISFNSTGGPAVTYEIERDLPRIMGDEAYLMEAFRGILKNAYRYTPEDGEITMTTRSHNNHIVVELRDTGPGIPEDILSDIFTTFWRLDLAHTTPGFGLGLSIAKQIIELHNGQIEVHSTVGKGSTYRITLPIQQTQLVL